MSGPTVLGVVVLNWNDAESTLACVRSLRRSTLRPNTVVVVDNGSEPACYERLRDARDELGFELIRSEENLGYGGGNNLGLRRLGHADQVLVLNNDVEVSPDALESLSRALEDDPTVGLAAPLVATGEGRVWFAGGHLDRWRGLPVHHSFGRPASEVAAEAGGDIGFATGCAALLRGDVFRSVGLVNEAFFLYWEDVELCRRVSAAGWRMVFRPEAQVVHRRGQSSDPLRNLSVTMLRHWTRNRLLYLRSFESGLPRACALAYTAVNTAGTLRRVMRLQGVDRRARARAVLLGTWEGLRRPRLPTTPPALVSGTATSRR